ncbi:MAG: hypothetical protein NWR17_11910 [Candidatus Nanopelagicales bacterium]|nr:hypothetical protein [Candidatus Nanopelagicales bacterium]MDP4907143.1 hypothetical protein [Candidatus Nanopelagicales bacterium]MDP4907948.1 hypothetical protein [Candidatus Nanopelagicales bacterium]
MQTAAPRSTAGTVAMSYLAAAGAFVTALIAECQFHRERVH